MQRILDREMPRRRRRIAGWWWFAGLLLVPALGITAWQLYEQSAPAAPAMPVRVPPIAPLAERTPNNVPPVHIDAITSSSTLSSENAVETVAFQKSANHKATGILNARLKEVEPFLTKKEGVVPAETPLAFLPETEGLDDETVDQLPASEPTANLAIDAMAALPALSPAIETTSTTPDFPTYPAYSSPEIIKKVTYKPKWNLGIVAGVTSEHLPRVNGATLGMVADWQPLRHWGLRSGVQYAVQQLAEDESLVTTIPEDSYERASTGVALFDQSGNYGNLAAFSGINTNILASVRRIHRFETPLLVYWQPVRKLRTYAGASVHYTFLAQTSPRIFSENQVFKVVSGRDELNKLATEKLNRWQVKWQFGLGYRFAHWGEINAGIHAALPKISLRKGGNLDDSQDHGTTSNTSISIEQVSQMAIHLRGVVFF